LNTSYKLINIEKKIKIEKIVHQIPKDQIFPLVRATRVCALLVDRCNEGNDKTSPNLEKITITY
jgi:hypothetical protein